MTMKPNREGMWEWYDENGIKTIVPVIDCGNPIDTVWLRVYHLGGYYNVNDEAIGTPDEPYCKAEWPDRWGNYVGELTRD